MHCYCNVRCQLTMNINLLGSWLFAAVCGIMNTTLHWNTLYTHSILTVEFIVRPFYKTIYEKSKAREEFRLALAADYLEGCIVV